jgi:GNAT superfamily N-acetyltransferase
VTPFPVRRCAESDWPEVRRLHIRMALGIPVAVEVELNDVLATPDVFWQEFTSSCAVDADQALFLVEADGACVGMGHVHVERPLARLDMVFVREGSRRRGAGATMVDTLERWAREAGAHELVCHIPEGSPASHLAERAGWQRTQQLFSTKNRLAERRWVKKA